MDGYTKYFWDHKSPPKYNYVLLVSMVFIIAKFQNIIKI